MFAFRVLRPAAAGRYISALFAALLAIAPAAADAAPVFGRPVDSLSAASSDVGSIGADGYFDFYIPIRETSLGNASEFLYGVHSNASGVAGAYVDTCNPSVSACVGRLDMYLRFDPETAGASGEVTLSFEDLDLDGVNDPNRSDFHLLESVAVYDAALNLIGNYSAFGDPGVVAAMTDYDSQMIRFQVSNVDQPLLLRLTLYGELTGTRTGRNTLESMRAELRVDAPAPGSLALFAVGLFAIVGARRLTLSRRDRSKS